MFGIQTLLYFMIVLIGQHDFYELGTVYHNNVGYRRFYPGKHDKKFDSKLDISCENVNATVLGPQQTNSEDFSEKTDIAGLVQTTLTTAVGALGGAVPIIGGSAYLLLTLIFELTGDTSDWRNKFKETILRETDLKDLKNEAMQLYALLEAIHKSLSSAEMADTGTVAWDTRKDIDYMMNIFAAHKSIFKQYPFIGAPILAELAKMISKFNRNLINDKHISCKIRNILLEYRNRTVEARLDKISFEFCPLPGPGNNDDPTYKIPRLYNQLIVKERVMVLPYSSVGYNKTSKWSCEHTDIFQSYGAIQYPFADNEYSVPNEFMLTDEFGLNYLFPMNVILSNVRGLQTADSLFCAEEYFGWVRHLTE